MRTRLSDHRRLAAGAILGAIAAALFAEGVVGAPPDRSAPDDRAAVIRDGVRAPEPLPGQASASTQVTQPPAAPTTTTTPTSTTTTTTTVSTTTTTRKSTPTTTTTTVAATTTTTTTTRPPTTTTTTRHCGLILC